MDEGRTHHTTTTDGITIAGSVHGQGPPLVFVHGILGDGDSDWQGLLPHVADRYTCHLPSTRGRGLSDDHPDHGRGRLVEDIVAYVDSLGEPTGMVGFSSGGGMTLAAAVQAEAVNAVAVYEPALTALLDERQHGAFRDTVVRVGELASEGDLTAAARAWAGFVFHDHEVARMADAGYLELAARSIPALLNDIQQGLQSEGPDPADPALLGGLSMPLLVLRGPDTALPWFTTCVQHVADHVPDATVRELPGAGHGAPLTVPEPLGTAVAGFFDRATQPA
jgi:pimeloyl-ACP methyl ester carboxylesterase